MYDALNTTSAAANDEFGNDVLALSIAASTVPAVRANADSRLAAEDQQAGRVMLDNALLRQLRRLRLLSQQDLADECWRRNIRVSIATIKRAESGHAVRYRIAHELARCFEVPVLSILQTDTELLADRCADHGSANAVRSQQRVAMNAPSTNGTGNPINSLTAHG